MLAQQNQKVQLCKDEFEGEIGFSAKLTLGRSTTGR
jgi:hypothetical protein